MEYKRSRQAEQAREEFDRDGKGLYPISIGRIRKTEYPLLDSKHISLSP